MFLRNSMSSLYNKIYGKRPCWIIGLSCLTVFGTGIFKPAAGGYPLEQLLLLAGVCIFYAYAFPVPLATLTGDSTLCITHISLRLPVMQGVMHKPLDRLNDGVPQLRYGLGLERKPLRDEQFVQLDLKGGADFRERLVARPQSQAFNRIHRLLRNLCLLRKVELRPALNIPVL